MYGRPEDDANKFRVEMKAKAKDADGRTPFQNHEVYHLSRIEYAHDVDTNEIKIMTWYKGSDNRYEYTCSDNTMCVEMMQVISMQMDDKYREEIENRKLDRLIF